MSKFAKFTLVKFVLPTDTSSEEFCTAYYFLHGSLEGKFSVVKSCNTILQLRILLRKSKFFCINVYENAKEKLSLDFLITKIETDTTRACFPNSWCNPPPPSPPSITHRVKIAFEARQNCSQLSNFHE